MAAINIDNSVKNFKKDVSFSREKTERAAQKAEQEAPLTIGKIPQSGNFMVDTSQYLDEVLPEVMHVYRRVNVKTMDEVNLEEPGNYWAETIKGAVCSGYAPEEGKPFFAIIKGEAKREDVDLKTSVARRRAYGEPEIVFKKPVSNPSIIRIGEQGSHFLYNKNGVLLCPHEMYEDKFSSFLPPTERDIADFDKLTKDLQGIQLTSSQIKVWEKVNPEKKAALFKIWNNLLSKNGFVFRRGQKEYSGFLENGDGQSGIGVYAFPANEKRLEAYYTKDGEDLIAIRPTSYVSDLRKEIPFVLEECKRQGINANTRDYYKQPFALQAYMQKKHPMGAGFIVPHNGEGVPSGMQAVFKEDKIDHESTNPLHLDENGFLMGLDSLSNRIADKSYFNSLTSGNITAAKNLVKEIGVRTIKKEAKRIEVEYAKLRKRKLPIEVSYQGSPARVKKVYPRKRKDGKKLAMFVMIETENKERFNVRPWDVGLFKRPDTFGRKEDWGKEEDMRFHPIFYFESIQKDKDGSVMPPSQRFSAMAESSKEEKTK